MRSPESLEVELDGVIAALADRYELTEESVDALQGLVRLVDWQAPNLVRRSGKADGRRKKPRDGRPEKRPEKRRDPASMRRVASNLLSESLASMEFGPVRTARRLADMGSGAGFPGLVLAAALPHARLTLIEKIPRKCSFLRRAASELGLANVQVVEGTVQEWSEGVASCDVVTSRKLGRPETMLEWSRPLLAQEGWVALWPGSSSFEEEPPETAAGLRLVQIIPLEWESRRGRRSTRPLSLYEKIGEG
jgi:16S rRNA (guanine(527)-N(7))-methyltransferase RsmG